MFAIRYDECLGFGATSRLGLSHKLHFQLANKSNGQADEAVRGPVGGV